MSKRNEVLENVLFIVCIVAMVIVVLSFVLIAKCDAMASSKKSASEIRIEKHIKSYAKKKHKAKGVRFVGERGATKKVLKYANKKQKNKNKKYFKKDVCEKYKVEIIDRFGGYITCQLGKGGVIDGIRDDWKPGTKVWKYQLYNWKTKKYSTYFIAE